MSRNVMEQDFGSDEEDDDFNPAPAQESDNEDVDRGQVCVIPDTAIGGCVELINWNIRPGNVAVRTTLKIEAMTTMGRTRAVEMTMSFRKEGMRMRKRRKKKKTKKRMLLRFVSSTTSFS